jgi:hypothetical protein
MTKKPEYSDDDVLAETRFKPEPVVPDEEIVARREKILAMRKGEK